MNSDSLALLFALGATLSFATSSFVYADYSRKISVLWMNCFKASIALAALLLTIPIFTTWHTVSIKYIGALMLSGAIGLNIADLFLLSAFIRLGVARTLVLFGFQPLFLGIAAHFLYDQQFHFDKLIAVIFLVGCLFTFSLEKYRIEKRWEVKGLLFALIGVGLDTCGILLTRSAFSSHPDLSPLEGHLYRCIGALLVFALISFYRPIHLYRGLTQLKPQVRGLLVIASLGGTYLSLILYLSAVKIGHLASISAVAITGPLFATVFECVRHKKRPSRYLLFALAFFAIGFSILWHSS